MPESVRVVESRLSQPGPEASVYVRGRLEEKVEGEKVKLKGVLGRATGGT